jgi:hypothetical protein
MATNMAPHNLTEVIDGTLAYIDKRDIEVAELMQFVKAPDFPTGGIIYGYEGVKDAFETGRGRIVMRAKATFETSKTGKDQIIVNESQLKELRTLLHSKSSNVVLVPTHKSYMDSILLGYIHYHYKLDYPFVCGSEAFFALALISIIIKSTNGFYFNS